MSKKGRISLKTVFITLLIVVAVVTGGILYYLNGIGPVDSSDSEDVSVTIPPGSGASYIVSILDDAGLVKDSRCAKINARIGGYDSLQANTYIFSKSMTLPEMMKAINTGDFNYVSKVKFQLMEGYRLSQCAQALSEVSGFDKKDIMKKWDDKAYVKELINKYWFLTDDILNPDVIHPLEGYLYPDTYFITEEEPTIESLTELALDEMDQKLTARKAKIKASDFTMNEFLTLSSIVCKEGNQTPEDAAHIAGVFINRLNKGMSLGSDVTVNYIYDDDKVDLKQSQLDNASKYNLRKHSGLTPGPICTVPESAMDAVLNYTKTDDLFFYSCEDGTLKFFKTNEEFNAGWEKDKWSDSEGN